MCVNRMVATAPPVLLVTYRMETNCKKRACDNRFLSPSARFI